MKVRTVAVGLLTVLVGCSPTSPVKPPRNSCPDRGEGIHVAISGRITSYGSTMVVPCTVTNRTQGNVTRIRYVIGFFGDSEPPMADIRRTERQMNLALAPGETKSVEFEMDHRNDPPMMGGNSLNVCFGVRAVPVAVDGAIVPQDEAWAHEH